MSEKSPKEKNFTIESFGGTGGLITGSLHKIQIGNSNVAVDCGMFQGRKEERLENGVRTNFYRIGDIVRGVTEVLLTHSHMDHSGKLPLVFKNGFTPKVWMTETASFFLEPMLENSAEIQERENPQNRLYVMTDVVKTLNNVYKAKIFKEIPVGEKHSHLTAEFLPNGHVMGSASIILRDRDYEKTILFTGDMGKPNQSLCGGYEEYAYLYPNDPIKTLLVESTSFDKEPISFKEKLSGFLNSIKETWSAGGNPLFPTLSFHRAQELMEIIHNCQRSGDIPKDCEIVIDAPLAMKVLDVFSNLDPNNLTNRYGDDPNYYKTIKSSLDRFNLENKIIIEDHLESINADRFYAKYPKKAIIIASGGMGDYGRSVNYLRGNFAKNPKNSIVFFCYQVEGTEGARLVKSKPEKTKKEKARIIHLGGFTSHVCGARETFGFLERFNLDKLETIIITHGKDTVRQKMAAEFVRRGYPTPILSKMNQVISI